MALVWLYSRQVPLALLPFAVYSVFHVATYTRTNLIPTIQPPSSAPAAGPTSPNSSRPSSSSSPLANSIGKFVKEYYDTSMSLVAALEIALWFRVLLTALTFTKGSWILLGVYTMFLRARYTQSQFVQSAFTHATATVDAQVQNQSVPPAVRQGWETTKGLARQALDATDMRRYLGGSQGQGTKKPQ
jgi:transmembrane protein 33